MEADPMDQVPVQVEHYGKFFYYFFWLDDGRYISVTKSFHGPHPCLMPNGLTFGNIFICHKLHCITLNSLVILQFRKWFDDALAASLKEPNAMALSTAGKDGKP